MARPTSLQMKVALSVESKPLRFGDTNESGSDTLMLGMMQNIVIQWRIVTFCPLWNQLRS